MTTHQAYYLNLYEIQDLDNPAIVAKLEEMFSEEMYDANYFPF